MKTKLASLISLLTLLTTSAQGFLSPSNPPPVVQLSWTASPSVGVTNYFIYYGTGSLQYTQKILVGTNLNLTLALPSRGPTYFFSVTAQSNGLESPFSNEVNFTPAVPPASPGMKIVIVLTVQSKSPTDALWSDADMNWSLSPDASGRMFRLLVAQSPNRLAATSPPMPQ